MDGERERYTFDVRPYRNQSLSNTPRIVIILSIVKTPSLSRFLLPSDNEELIWNESKKKDTAATNNNNGTCEKVLSTEEYRYTRGSAVMKWMWGK